MQKFNAVFKSLFWFALVSCLGIAQANARQDRSNYYHEPSGCYLDVEEDLIQYNSGYPCDGYYQRNQRTRKRVRNEAKQPTRFERPIGPAPRLEEKPKAIAPIAVPEVEQPTAPPIRVKDNPLKPYVLEAVEFAKTFLDKSWKTIIAMAPWLPWAWLLGIFTYLGYRIWKFIRRMQKLNRLIRSAEFAILEKYRRWRRSDGGDSRVSKNLKLFNELAAPTVEINKERTLRTAFINTATPTPPVNVFKDESAAVYASRQDENKKAIRRKASARQTLNLYKNVLFGEPSVAFQEIQRLVKSEKENDQAALAALSSGVIALATATDLTRPYMMNLAKYWWHYPATLDVKDAEGEVLTGLKALDYMERELAGLEEEDV